MRNGQGYAGIEVTNESSSSKPLAECKVSAVSIASVYDYENADKVVLNGVSIQDITPDKMTEVSGKPYETTDYKSYSDEAPTGTEYIWKKHAYSMSVIIADDGSLYEISSKYEK